jgi:hypothetical protein
MLHFTPKWELQAEIQCKNNFSVIVCNEIQKHVIVCDAISCVL